MTDDLPPPPDVSGISLTGAEAIVITGSADRALCHATGVEPATDGTAHPSWFFGATQRAMGKTVAGLCKACDFDVADGPMMTGCHVTFSTPIRIDIPYHVEGEIIGLTRKRGRTLGVMDILQYELRLVEEDGAVVLVTRNSWALPRRELV